MSWRYHLVWFVLVLAASGAGLWAVKDASRYRALAEQANEALAASQARSRANARLAARHAADAAELRRSLAAEREDLNHAIQAAPDWAAGALPDGVRRSLAGDPGDPAGAPAGGLSGPVLRPEDQR